MMRLLLFVTLVCCAIAAPSADLFADDTFSRRQTLAAKGLDLDLVQFDYFRFDEAKKLLTEGRTSWIMVRRRVTRRVTYGSNLFASLTGCNFDGHVYQAGETIMIDHCLATMQCLGYNNYGQMKSLGGVCPDKRQVDGQTGCLFDGTVYAPGDKIIIQHCLAEMTCKGHNSYSYPTQLGGECPSKKEVDGQTGCLFDGTVYAPGDKIIIQPCLVKMTCNGHNSYSLPQSLYGQC